MNNPPRNTPRDEPTPHESSDRPAPWVLDLGLEVASGRRPWLQPLAGAALLFGTPFLIKMIGGADLAAAEKAPELAAFIDQLTGFVTAFSWVLAGISLVLGVGYWFICRHAYAAWCSLPEEEREELARQRVEALSRALARLGGIDPAGLPITSEDLEQLGDRHRLLLEDLRVRSSQTATQICAGARARTDDLVMAGRLHRALSKDTIVRPPHAASSATDPRVLALVELDTEIQAEAAAIGESLDTGHCNCDQDTHERLIRAGDLAHARLHGPDRGQVTGRRGRHGDRRVRQRLQRVVHTGQRDDSLDVVDLELLDPAQCRGRVEVGRDRGDDRRRRHAVVADERVGVDPVLERPPDPRALDRAGRVDEGAVVVEDDGGEGAVGEAHGSTLGVPSGRREPLRSRRGGARAAPATWPAHFPRQMRRGCAFA